MWQHTSQDNISTCNHHDDTIKNKLILTDEKITNTNKTINIIQKDIKDARNKITEIENNVKSSEETATTQNVFLTNTNIKTSENRERILDIERTLASQYKIDL